jgi:hypothetical protein
VYATKGNNTQGFWRYSIDSLTWTQFPVVPMGPSGKRVKGGTDMVYVQEGDTGYAYLLKGYKQDFFRFNTVSGVWDTSLPMAPAGGNPKWDKGSWVVYDGTQYIYAHKAKYHELWQFDVATHTWGTAALPGMPLAGMMGKSKKSKDGGSAAYYAGAIYALKGGNTQEFWKLTLPSPWAEKETMPAFGSTGKKKRVKAGGDIVSWGGGAFFALKGNKTLEMWRYVEDLNRQPRGIIRSGIMSGLMRDRAQQVGFASTVVSGRRLRLLVDAHGPSMLRLFDVAGRIVISRTFVSGRASHEVDLGRLAAGAYLAEVRAPGLAATRKLIVQ